jgi:hypothetical protein
MQKPCTQGLSVRSAVQELYDFGPKQLLLASASFCRLLGLSKYRKRDLRQVQAHGLRVASGQDQGRALALLRADRPEGQAEFVRAPKTLC